MCGWHCSQLNDQFPELGDGSTVSLQDNYVIVFDSDPVSGERYIAAGITKLSNGQQWLSGQLRDNETMVCCKLQSWQIKVSFMGGLEDCTRQCVDLDWFESRVFVANQGGTGEEMCCAARVGNGIERLCGRTSGRGRQ